jgi:ABC-2 type transport system ATP-binding protein
MSQTETTEQPEDVLVLNELTKSFGGHQAVTDVTFSVRPGEVFGFLGPNGAGKSTTIRMILDVLRPSSGSVTIFGEQAQGAKSARRRLGYLSGDMTMDENLTGRQYLAFAAHQYGKDCAQRRDELAERLQSELDVRIGEYSRGNRQKIGLVAALQHQPELLILDEPTSGFDPLVQEEFAKLISEHKSAGGTVFMSSHILSEVQGLCDRVAFIKDGRIADITTVEALTVHAAKRVTVKAPLSQLGEMRQRLKLVKGVRPLISNEEYVLRFTYSGPIKAVVQLLGEYDVQDVTIKEPELEEIFMHYYQKTNNDEKGSPA